jgi:carbon monoxide dehydrogenase subunit G
MAYLRKEKETVEIDYPLAKVWAVIPEVLASLEWTTEQIDGAVYCAKVKTKAGFMSYASTLAIDGVPVDEKKCRITVQGETPVTTITAVADFGRTSDRIHLFFKTLAKRLNTAKKS